MLLRLQPLLDKSGSEHKAGLTLRNGTVALHDADRLALLVATMTACAMRKIAAAVVSEKKLGWPLRPRR